jgi:hypothetical protein
VLQYNVTGQYNTIQYNNTHHTKLNTSHKITYNTQGKVVTRGILVVGYRRCGTTCRPHRQGSSSSRRPTVFTDVSGQRIPRNIPENRRPLPSDSRCPSKVWNCAPPKYKYNRLSKICYDGDCSRESFDT